MKQQRVAPFKIGQSEEAKKRSFDQTTTPQQQQQLQTQQQPSPKHHCVQSASAKKGDWLLANTNITAALISRARDLSDSGDKRDDMMAKPVPTAQEIMDSSDDNVEIMLLTTLAANMFQKVSKVVQPGHVGQRQAALATPKTALSALINARRGVLTTAVCSSVKDKLPQDVTIGPMESYLEVACKALEDSDSDIQHMPYSDSQTWADLVVSMSTMLGETEQNGQIEKTVQEWLDNFVLHFVHVQKVL